MADSTNRDVFSKPRADFPLFPHKSGRWAKKVRGKFAYFGKCADDPKGQAALNLWLEQRDDLMAGRKPRGRGEAGVTMRDLVNRFLTAKLLQQESGELSPHAFRDYRRICEFLIDHLGKSRLVSDLRSDDFEKLRAELAKTHNAVSLGNRIQRIRVVFNYGYDAGLIEREVKFGPMFKRPSRKTLRMAKAKQGPKLFKRSEILALLNKSTPQMRAMILLALNAGYGNNDCATLPLAAVDLKRGWIAFPRPKTGIDRRAPLWPETVAALNAVIASRKQPKDPAHAGLVFITKAGGTWSKGTSDNPVSKEFAKLLKAADVAAGRGFYALRHTFRTVADESRDQPACDALMGHARDDMASIYRERISDDRLQAVANHVRRWLFGFRLEKFNHVGWRPRSPLRLRCRRPVRSSLKKRV